MSLIPRPMPGDFYRNSWHDLNLPEDKPVRSLDDLRRALPDKEIVVEDGVGYVVYELKTGKGSKVGKVAYSCKKCDTFFVGMPIVRDDTSIGDGHPLAGREGFDVFCGNCEAHLYGETYRIS